MNDSFPMKRDHKLSVAIPASLVSDVPHLREKTIKIGLVGRSLAIFRVDEVIIYIDNPNQNLKRDLKLISTVLSYMETPQYLRKRLFRIRPELRYLGVLPPLRTLHHPLGKSVKDLIIPKYREGVVVKTDRKGSWVDVGVEKFIRIPRSNLQLGKRVTVNLETTKKEVKARLIQPEKIDHYWGFKVLSCPKTFIKMLKTHKFELSIATSRRGINLMSIADVLVKRWVQAENILLVLGSPSRGLHEIVQQEGTELKEIVDFIVNTIPNQGTKTIRTEEALQISLAALDLLTSRPH